jgi:hypothetical protein
VKWLTDNGYSKAYQWDIEWDAHEGHGIYAKEDLPEGAHPLKR